MFGVATLARVSAASVLKRCSICGHHLLQKRFRSTGCRVLISLRKLDSWHVSIFPARTLPWPILFQSRIDDLSFTREPCNSKTIICIYIIYLTTYSIMGNLLIDVDSFFAQILAKLSYLNVVSSRLPLRLSLLDPADSRDPGKFGPRLIRPGGFGKYG